LHDVGDRLAALAKQWIVNTDGVAERDRRVGCARRVLDWMTSDAHLVYQRVEGLKRALCVYEGDQYRLSDIIDQGTHSAVDRLHGVDERFGEALWEFWESWADRRVAAKWDRFTQANPQARPWPAADEIAQLSTHLKDYFRSPPVAQGLTARLTRLVGLRPADENARSEARRRYVRLLLDDLIFTPGLPEVHADTEASGPPSTRPIADREPAEKEFGLMTGFVRRWQSRLPRAVAGGAGNVVEAPLGNDELIRLIRTFAMA
jgi:hypothetical protein